MDLDNCDKCDGCYECDSLYYIHEGDYWEYSICRSCMLDISGGLSDHDEIVIKNKSWTDYLRRSDRIFKVNGLYYDVEAMTEEQVDQLDEEQKIEAKAYLKRKKESGAVYKELKDWRDSVKLNK